MQFDTQEEPEASHIASSQDEQGQGEGCNEGCIFVRKLLCDPPAPPPPLPGYPAGGRVGLRVGGWVSQNPGWANLTSPARSA